MKQKRNERKMKSQEKNEKNLDLNESNFNLKEGFRILRLESPLIKRIRVRSLDEKLELYIFQFNPEFRVWDAKSQSFLFGGHVDTIKHLSISPNLIILEGYDKIKKRKMFRIYAMYAKKFILEDFIVTNIYQLYNDDNIIIELDKGMLLLNRNSLNIDFIYDYDLILKRFNFYHDLFVVTNTKTNISMVYDANIQRYIGPEFTSYGISSIGLKSIVSFKVNKGNKISFELNKRIYDDSSAPVFINNNKLKNGIYVRQKIKKT